MPQTEAMRISWDASSRAACELDWDVHSKQHANTEVVVRPLRLARIKEEVGVQLILAICPADATQAEAQRTRISYRETAPQGKRPSGGPLVDSSSSRLSDDQGSSQTVEYVRVDRRASCPSMMQSQRAAVC